MGRGKVALVATVFITACTSLLDVDGYVYDAGSGANGACDASLCPASTDPCREAACVGDLSRVPPSIACGFAARAEREPCGDGMFCDAAGQCVECITEMQCEPVQLCQNGHCVPGTCGNGMLDAGETGIDCGGMCAPCPGGNGAPCTQPSDCQSGFCVDGVCCNQICDALCEACVESKTSQDDGQCNDVIAGTDPDDECPGGVCDGNGACMSSTCGSTPTPPGGTCPAVCTGGCAQGGTRCDIACTGGSACQNDVIVCPAGFACNVNCGGTAACDGATIQCPADYYCELHCSGNDACADATLVCSAGGKCDMFCGLGTDVCQAANVVCGANACAATCTGSPPLPVMTCNNSCLCTGC